MAKHKSKGSSKKHSFSQKHGSQHPMMPKVGGDQLGHDTQMDVNPNPGGQPSPLMMPGGPNTLGVGMGNPGEDGM